MFVNRFRMCYSSLRIISSSVCSNSVTYPPTSNVKRRPVILKFRICQDFRLPYSTKDLYSSSKTENEKKKPKKEIKTYITLIGIDQSISITTLEEATKLASRRNFKVVKKMDFDPKTSRAVYQLMTGAQYVNEDKEWETSKSKTEKFIKGTKVVSLSSSTNENDVLTKVKMIKKWLTKSFEVRVVISGDANSGEKVYKIIEREIGSDGRIVQKRSKGIDIRFQIIPPKKTEIKSSEESGREST